MSFKIKGLFAGMMTEGVGMFSDMITPETAEATIQVLDNIENHALLKDDNAYVIQKHKGKLKLIHIKGSSITYDDKPMVIDLQEVVDEIRGMAETKLDEIGYFDEEE